jgi:uncharacterized phage protein (TIGR02218 family)
MVYGAFENTRQQAAPVELYRLFWGNRSVAGNAASPPDEDEAAGVVFFDDFNYDDAAAAEAAGWDLDPQDWGASTTFAIDATGGQDGGTALKASVSEGIKPDILGPRIAYTVTGLNPTATYTVSTLFKFGAGFATDEPINLASYFPSFRGGSASRSLFLTVDPEVEPYSSGVQYIGQWGIIDHYNPIEGGLLIMSQPNEAGELLIEYEFHIVCCLVGHDMEMWLDKVRVTGPPLAPPDPPPPPVGTPLTELNYTTADVPIEYQGNTYIPMIGHRTPILSGSGERRACSVDLTLPRDHPISTFVRSGRTPIGVEIYQLDRGDLEEAAVPLRGQVMHVEMDNSNCIITLGNLGTLLTRKLPMYWTQQACSQVLYGPRCRVSKAAFTHPGLVVTNVTGRRIDISGLAAIVGDDTTYFVEGILKTADGRSGAIEEQGDGFIVVRRFVDGLEPDDIVTLIAGCSRTAFTCDERFSNIQNFGGEIGMKERNLWEGAGIVQQATEGQED